MPRQTISIAITRFVALICILLALLITTLVIEKVLESHHQLQNHNNEREAKTLSNNYKMFLHDRLILLQEQAKLPLMLQTVMQPESNLGNISDLMQGMSMLGKKYNQSLLDFAGNTIYSTGESPTNFKQQTWIQPLLNSEQISSMQLLIINQQYYWVLSATISYQSISQGILLIEIPVAEIHRDKILDGLSIEIVNLQTNIIKFGEHIDGEVIEITWSDLPVTLRITFDQTLLTPKLYNLLLELAIIIAAVTFAILITAYFYAHYTFVKPLVSLSAATEDLEQGLRQTELHENIKIYEFARLFKQFNKMVRQVEQRESSLKEANRQLSQANKDRKLSESQLVQSEKMASIGVLAAGIAHEINNPIGFIKSNFQVFQEYTDSLCAYTKEVNQLLLDEQQIQQQKLAVQHDIEYILSDLPLLLSSSISGIDRVSEIVTSLKDFSRLDAPDKTLMDINESLQTSIKMVNNEIKYHCELHLQLGEIPQIMVYPGKLNQVFMNLIMNAGQAISHKGDIYIRTFQDNGFVVIEIEDTGSGISDLDFKNIFTPFYTTKDIGKGTGLGLSICHNIIEQHGGSIKVRSVLGKGTTFSILLAI
jgi:two-component system NtrC family sensor kinase